MLMSGLNKNGGACGQVVEVVGTEALAAEAGEHGVQKRALIGAQGGVVKGAPEKVLKGAFNSCACPCPAKGS